MKKNFVSDFLARYLKGRRGSFFHFWLRGSSLLLLTGCLTTGPTVYQSEIYQVEEELRLKALEYKLEKEKEVSQVGYRLLQALPLEGNRYYPYLGIRFIQIDRYVKKLFALERDRGIAVAYLVPGGPAEKAGLREADIVRAIDNYPVMNYWDLKKALRGIQPGETLLLRVERNGLPYQISIRVGKVPLNVQFLMADAEEVNAGATSNRVVVTYGMMRFLKTQDELAIILGHELAHITRGHIAKRLGTDLLSLIIGIAAGYGAESVSPGSGDIVMQGVGAAFGASFSREFEREADYFGILYAQRAGYDVSAGIEVWERFAIEIPESMVRDFFSTHPTSTERLLRIRKIVEELKKKEIN